MFTMNTQATGWDDVHLRRAVAYGLNRTDIIAANGGCATPASILALPQQQSTVNAKAAT
jgi:peptide/nickel transport system substrate-binding protein